MCQVPDIKGGKRLFQLHLRAERGDLLEKFIREIAARNFLDRGEILHARGVCDLPAEGFLQALRERCDRTGTLLIFDEVQTGFGRTGRMFAFEKFGVVPDILVLAKALGGGMPLGGVVSSKQRLDAFTSDPVLGHITTFGGHPVCCAAALASLRILLREDWVQGAEAKGQYIEDSLRPHPAVKEIRRAGLLLAVDLGSPEAAERMLGLLMEEGAVSDYFLYNPTSFRIAPPLSIGQEDVDTAIEIVTKALDRL